LFCLGNGSAHGRALALAEVSSLFMEKWFSTIRRRASAKGFDEIWKGGRFFEGNAQGKEKFFSRGGNLKKRKVNSCCRSKKRQACLEEVCGGKKKIHQEDWGDAK